MTIRTFWLNLGWLVMLVVTVAVPLALDAVDRLTYFTSLVLWGLPILYLWPVFNMITADGTGRRRRALRWTAGTIVLLGIVLDFLLGHLTLRFPGCSEPEGAAPYLLCLPAVSGSIPIEELLFYAMGPVAIVLVYACADELWLSRYNPKDDLLDLKLIQLSPRLADRRRRRRRHGAGPLARERNLSDLFHLPRCGSLAAGDVPVPGDRQPDELAGVCRHHAVRHRHLADLGGDARDPTAVVGIRAVGDGRTDDRRLVARRRHLSRRGGIRVALRAVLEHPDLRVRQGADASSARDDEPHYSDPARRARQVDSSSNSSLGPGRTPRSQGRTPRDSFLRRKPRGIDSCGERTKNCELSRGMCVALERATPSSEATRDATATNCDCDVSASADRDPRRRAGG